MAEKIKVLRVVARTDSFRRAGYQFGADAVDIPMDELTGAQGKKRLDAIMADPNLVANELEVDADAVESPQVDATTSAAAGGRSRSRKTT
ncbi:hypothetical protein [Achromobacter sp. 2789STDY5608621]|uniref:hypothetical protein n=1 Tax=Achromobacter sp. 2789STDY5608621 TaxID=1806496 RepID=UPI0006C2775D|nr:hypothetical protein [Achromobacter sp. 2789STDY5608621]CUJ55577.1 Uncharacterised protein [Achromobacter sp. 2789STDY5608621]